MSEELDVLKEEDFWIDPEMVSREIKNHGMFNVIHREYLIKKKRS